MRERERDKEGRGGEGGEESNSTGSGRFVDCVHARGAISFVCACLRCFFKNKTSVRMLVYRTCGIRVGPSHSGVAEGVASVGGVLDTRRTPLLPVKIKINKIKRKVLQVLEESWVTVQRRLSLYTHTNTHTHTHTHQGEAELLPPTRCY